MVRTQIQLSPEDYQELREVARLQGRSMADCIREGIGLFLRGTRAVRTDLSAVPSFRCCLEADLKEHDQWWIESSL